MAQLAGFKAGQQSAVVHTQEAIAAGGSKVKEDLSNVEGQLAKLKQEIKRMKMMTKRFPPSVNKGKLRVPNSKESDEMYDIPDGIIAHLTKECGGNVRDWHVVQYHVSTVREGDSWANYGAENAAGLETRPRFASVHRSSSENISHTRNHPSYQVLMSKLHQLRS
jgi:hypothetical protein